MTVRPRTLRRAAALAGAVTLLVAAPAAAHPFFRGGEAPVDSLATLTLAMAHGCGDEAAGGGQPTTDVAMEVPAWMRIVEVADADGWLVDLERDDEDRVEVVTWTADGAVEPAPDFDLDVVVTGEVGEERFVRVFQACDGFEYRWVGTPDDPADDPAIRLRLVDADPDNPAPAPEPAPTPGPDEEAGDGDDPSDGTQGADVEGAGDEPTGVDETSSEDAAGAGTEVDGEPLADTGGTPLLWVALAGLAVVALLAALVRARRRGPGPTEV